jgi:type I restriction enzyme S subunit
MELKPGYKQTEVGVIPDDWEAARLGDHAAFRTGPFGSSLHKSDYTNDGVYVINPMHLIEGRIEPTRTMSVTEPVARHLSEFRLETGDIIIGRRGDMGRCAVVRESQVGWLCGTGSMIIRCEKSGDADFLQRVLSSPRAIAAIQNSSVGTTMVNLNQDTLASLLIQFPPLAEQRAIAEALNDVDGLLAGLDRLIAKKRDLKHAAMQQLLIGQTRLSGFSGDWDVVAVHQIGEVVTGKALAVHAPGKQRPYLRTKNVFDGRIDIEDVLTMPMTDEQFAHFRVRRGDVLLNEGQSLELVGRCSLYLDEYPEPCAMQNQLLRFRARKGVCPVFASYLFRYCQQTGVFARIALQTTSIAHLGGSRFEQLHFAWPHAEAEQRAIAEVLSDMDAEIAALEQQREKTRALKQAMMQELLTGKTRLLAPEAAHA